MRRDFLNLFWLTRALIGFVFGLIEFVLFFRFVLKLFGANPATDFINWWYDMSGPLLDPFRGIFPTTVFENTYILEFSTLFAIIMYAIVYLILTQIVVFFESLSIVDVGGDDED